MCGSTASLACGYVCFHSDVDLGRPSWTFNARHLDAIRGADTNLDSVTRMTLATPASKGVLATISSFEVRSTSTTACPDAAALHTIT